MSIPNFSAQAELYRLTLMQTEPRISDKYETADTLAMLVKKVMAKPRPADRQLYLIRVGGIVYRASEIEALYNLPNFPRE